MNKDLHDFLKNNSSSRESLLRYRFCSDMKFSAAKRGYDLKVYTADVDNDGSDLVFEDGDTVRKIQLKSVYGKNSEWPIHATMLKPEAREFEALDFVPQGTIGAGGAVVLQEITDIEPELKVRYHFTDIYLLRAMEWNIVRRSPPVSAKAIDQLAMELADARLFDKVWIGRSMFAQAKSTDHLLAILSFHSPLDIATPFRHHVVEYGNCKFSTHSNEEMDAFANLIQDQLVDCCANLKRPK